MSTLLGEIRRRVDRAVSEMTDATVDYDVSVTKPGFGDASSNVAFILAGVLGERPGKIAARVSDAYNAGLEPGGLVVRAVPHASGHVNFEANWPRLSRAILSGSMLDTFGDPSLGQGTRVTVEHTSVNPNKALHIGHVRNVVIGDTISRILRKSGYEVSVLNYVDDSGLQVADIIVGFRHLGFDPEPPPGKKFAQYCGDDVYVRTTEKYESDPSLENLRRDTLKEIEDASSETAALADRITRRVLADQLETCWRLLVYYDCLNFESQIIRSGLWHKVFEKLKQMNLVELDRSGGKNDGCWVIRDAHARADSRSGRGARGGSVTHTEPHSGPGVEISGADGGDDVTVATGDADGNDSRDKVIVRSNGTVTYIAKDIPYAAWKLGLLDDPFGYARYERAQPPDGSRTLWQTTLGRSEDGAKSFAGERVITVIDSRQSGLQDIIADLMTRFKSHESAYVHLAYESVTLSSDTAKALGMDTQGKRQAHMSGRRGLYVDADSVYDTLYAKAMEETAKRHPDLGDERVSLISHAISVGTIRYEMIKQDLDKIITFDLEKSLSLEGDTASYIQYAGARASRILEKAARGRADIVAADPALLTESFEIGLLKLIGSFDMVVSAAARNYSPKVVARYCHDPAVGFNTFYERGRVLGLDDQKLGDARLFLVHSFRATIAKALDLLGISAPEVM